MLLMHEPTISLTQKEIAFFREKGFLALDSLTTVEEVAWLIDVYDRLFAEKAGFEEGNQYDLAGTDAEDQALSLPQLVNPINYAPELGDILLQ